MGAVVRALANPTFVHNRFYDCHTGLNLEEQARGTFDDNAVFDCVPDCISVAVDATSDVMNNKLCSPLDSGGLNVPPAAQPSSPATTCETPVARR